MTKIVKKVMLKVKASKELEEEIENEIAERNDRERSNENNAGSGGYDSPKV